MAYAQGGWFRGIVWLVLMVFYIQTLNPVMLGYAPWQGSSPTGTETAGPSAWQRLLDFVIPVAGAQASDPLLASTPEFDLADPYLVEKAAELGNDPQRIFAFVRDEIGFESYVGSLRGARGALWSGAGNALDQASLLIALLRIAGIPARYVRGTLDQARARELILSMFEPPLRVLGCLPEQAILADPENDAELIAEVRQHFWVEFGAGGSFSAADPTFMTAQVGSTFTGVSVIAH